MVTRIGCAAMSFPCCCTACSRPRGPFTSNRWRCSGLSPRSRAALFATALPTLLARVFAARLTAARTAAFAVLCFIYWRGHLLHPLSDLPALLFLTVGVLYLRVPDDRDWSHWHAFVCGGCLAAAANVRPINEAALAGAVLLVSWWFVRAASRRRAVLSAGLFTLGVCLVAAPQAIVNSRTLGTRNPFAHPSTSPIAPNLYLQQLVWGASIQRYETNIGDTFPVSAIFTDRRGQELLGLDLRSDPRNSAHEAQLSVSGYIRLVSRAPLFFASAYLRHLFNGLDVAYPTPYSRKARTPQRPICLRQLSDARTRRGLWHEAAPTAAASRGRLAAVVGGDLCLAGGAGNSDCDRMPVPTSLVGAGLRLGHRSGRWALGHGSGGGRLAPVADGCRGRRLSTGDVDVRAHLECARVV